MLTLLSPIFLVGLLSAAIPLVIHLSRSRRTKKMRFSTTRFFTDQFLRSYRMSRLKELLLLACRMAICALLAMALAGPMLRPRGDAPAAGGSRAVVIVLDNSASMGLEENGQTMLARAQDAARELLDGLAAGDSAALVLASRRAAGPEVVFSEPTPRLGDVRQAVASTPLAVLGTDLSAAVRRAQGIAARSAADSKEIYVFSDLQDSGWEIADDKTTSPVAGSVVFFVRVRPEHPRDLAITALEYANSRPMVGVPFAFRPHIRNHASDPRSLSVRLVVDGDVVAERRIESLPGDRWAVPRLYHAFNRAGWHEGYVEIDDDSIAANNRRYFALEVVDSVRVLAINGAPSRVPRLDELFFFQTALAAARAHSESGRSAGAKAAAPLSLDIAAADALATIDLGHYRVVVLANVGGLSAASLERLESFVDRGGSLLIFLGDRINQPLFNQSLAGETRLHGGLSPGKLIGQEGNPVKPSGKQTGAVAQESMLPMAHVGQVDTDHAALAAFADLGSASLSGVGFTALWTLEPRQASVLMRADTGSPLLLEKEFGKGRVMLFASTCDRDWTNFPVRPAYLPWVYRLVAHLAQQPIAGQAFYHTGDLVRLPLSAEEGAGQVLVRTPDKTVRHATLGAADAALVFADTEEAGVYHVYMAGKEAAGGRFAANLESYESDLTFLDEHFAAADPHSADATSTDRIEAGFRELLGGDAAVAYVSEPRLLDDVSRTARRGVKLWDWLLWTALGIGLFEPWLANRISSRHYGRPSELPTSSTPDTGWQKNVGQKNKRRIV
jgi:hypothetical protein